MWVETQKKFLDEQTICRIRSAFFKSHHLMREYSPCAMTVYPLCTLRAITIFEASAHFATFIALDEDACCSPSTGKGRRIHSCYPFIYSIRNTFLNSSMRILLLSFANKLITPISLLWSPITRHLKILKLYFPYILTKY